MLGARDFLGSSSHTPVGLVPMRAMNVHVTHIPGRGVKSALSPIEQWQTELAREAHEGRGIDALCKILENVKTQYADDDIQMSSVIDDMRACAERHLTAHDSETVDAIFSAVFRTLNGSLDNIVLNRDVDSQIQRLASLPAVQYERERTAVAADLGLRKSALDTAVKAARPTDSKGQGRAFALQLIEPWTSAVNGSVLLDEISDAIKRYVVLRPEDAATLALWTLHTHCFNCFAHSPRAAITSPEKGCGKTTLLDVLGELVACPLPTSNATTAAIFRIIEMTAPTLLIDEADTFLKENDELRGVLNTGHRKGGQVIRTVGDDHEPRQFSTWAPAAIAMIGHLPDTLNDRSVVISLRRRKPSEKIESFRSDRAENLTTLKRKIARWAQDNQDALMASDPDMGELVNRTADNWRPLFAIADAAGGDWASRARKIAKLAVDATAEQSNLAQLLGDIQMIFEGNGGGNTPVDRMASVELVSGLVEIEGRPWAEWKNGKALTPNSLARLLGRFQISPGTIRLHTGDTAKGYYRAAFNDVFARYIPDQTVTPSQPNNVGHCNASRTVTTDHDVTLSKASQLNSDGHCDAVTVPTPRLVGMEGAERDAGVQPLPVGLVGQ